jgi:acetyl-CoA carboxylase biotin carboxyl carrier protein
MAKSEPKFEIDTQAIRELAALLEETGLTEIEVGDKERRLRVARQGTPVAVVAPPAPVAAPAAAPAAAVADDIASHPGALRSPMVGTAYLAPEPGAAAFVKVGDTVAQGQTLLIIEAMKVMNQIPAPRGGRIARILIESGSPVEYGQPLLLIE